MGRRGGSSRGVGSVTEVSGIVGSRLCSKRASTLQNCDGKGLSHRRGRTGRRGLQLLEPL
jgi:hypothetical protein